MVSAWTYYVDRHERIRGDDEFVLVTLHLLGYGTNNMHPDLWNTSFKVPREELHEWPLGSSVRLTLEVTKRG